MTKRGALVALTALFVSAAGLATPAHAAADTANLTTNLWGPGEAVAGGTADYRMFVSLNDPPADPSSVRAVLTVPAGTTVESAVAGVGGPCTVAGATVTCTGTTLPETPDTFDWTITVKIAGDLPLDSKLRFSMVASSAETDETPEDNNRTFDSTVVYPADLAISGIPPAGKVTLGQPVKYTLVIKNLGPGAVRRFALHEGFDSWYGGGTVTGQGEEGECFADPGRLVCDVVGDLQPGGEIRLEHTLPTRTDSDVRKLKQSIWVEIYPYAGDTNKANDTTTVKFEFAGKASSSPSPSPSVSPTETPTLPITGPATPSIGLFGLLFLLAGGAVVAATRRAGRP